MVGSFFDHAQSTLTTLLKSVKLRVRAVPVPLVNGQRYGGVSAILRLSRNCRTAQNVELSSPRLTAADWERILAQAKIRDVPISTDCDGSGISGARERIGFVPQKPRQLRRGFFFSLGVFLKRTPGHSPLPSMTTARHAMSSGSMAGTVAVIGERLIEGPKRRDIARAVGRHEHGDGAGAQAAAPVGARTLMAGLERLTPLSKANGVCGPSVLTIRFGARVASPVYSDNFRCWHQADTRLPEWHVR
jgi:hypothetical protein